MPTVFQSRNKRMRIVLNPTQNIYGRDGVTGTTKGTTVEFERHVFQVDEYSARKHGMSQTDLAAAIRDSALFNMEVWEIGNAPNAQKPSVEDMLLRITDAATRQDVARLRELLKLETDGDGEVGGHNRSEIIAAVERPLGILTGGKEGKLGPGRPYEPKPHNPEAVARKEMTKPG